MAENQFQKFCMFGDTEVCIETGRVARQAHGSVLVTMNNTVVLVTVVAAKQEKEGQNFFPLSVHYIEKTYAVGKIPGGYLKREGRPSDKETLTSRLIDRPIRPLFPKGFMNEVQVVCTVMSADKQNDPDIAAMIGTSAALAISGIPFGGPIAMARVGFTVEDGYMLNPTYEQLAGSELDMVVAGSEDAVLMVESEAKELTEDQMLGAVLFAQQEYRPVIVMINEFKKEFGKQAWDWEAPKRDEAVFAKIKALCEEKIRKAYQITDKQIRNETLSLLRKDTLESMQQEGSSDVVILGLVASLEKEIVRDNILTGKPRIDGRDLKTVRQLDVEVGVLPKTHGSSLFTRGETQALVIATMGTSRDAQNYDSLKGEQRDTFMLHYNFPPYSVGECGRLSGVGRREIGHGKLAKRGMNAVLPTEEEFPYTIRIVSEITESNGSSSMASVCGASLALMDAGIPIKSQVAGIAMGLIKEGENFSVLTDILGDEDHLGDMDFKVAGTSNGVTALQMDMKIDGITEEIMDIALQQALDARLHILEKMNSVISESRGELSENAPSTMTLTVGTDKIRDVIGKGGATIRSICEDTGASVDVNDAGIVKIFADTKEACQAAYDRVYGVTAEPEIGKEYSGTVARIVDFGAFVNILPGQDGLLHISQLAEERVDNVNDYLDVGQVICVVVSDVDGRGRIKLKMKNVIQKKQ